MVEVIRKPPSAARGLSARQRGAALAFRRATYSRLCRPPARQGRAGELRRHLYRLALEWPAYGDRRLTPVLRRQGLSVNQKRVLRVMREEQLVRRRRKPFVRTTNSQHRFPRSPNLLPTVSLAGRDQVWQADLTYMRLPQEFVYLAVILDAFSRRCIGWALEPSLEAELPLRALRRALAARPVPPGLIPHSEQGGQYASTESTERLKSAGIRISRSRHGNPYDNAKAESFFKTLKYEEVYRWESEDLAPARHRMGCFLEDVDNRKRLHPALGYRPPAECEQSLQMIASA